MTDDLKNNRADEEREDSVEANNKIDVLAIYIIEEHV